ncbi:MAG TPA: phosphomannomutase/phosphoglucomutase [Bacteroidales bacterium]|nr:phosphomannomutase/phosphoglucomutase [Bacteroidales bacterium]
MEQINLLELQNGSDIRGVAIQGIEGESVNLTPLIAEKVGVAFVEWLGKKLDKSHHSLRISVGRDSRISGPALLDSFVRGIRSMGATAINCGLSSTPAMFMSIVFEDTHFDGAAMLTASHLPFNRNGIKLFTPSGGLEKQDITEILTLAGHLKELYSELTGHIENFDLLNRYSQFLKDTIRKSVNHPTNFEKPLTGFKIVVDAGNGAGGFFAHQVLEPLGADITGSQFLDPDGMFPNHIPNPEDETAMSFIEKAVVANNADLGIIFDTDVDRAAAVDHKGNGINRNALIALISAIILEEHPRTCIVTDSITSDGLSYFIEKNLQGFHYRFKRGYKNVINEAIRLNKEGIECWIAIETSGHAALKENYFLDDGAFLVTKLLIKAAKLKLEGRKKLTDLIASLRMPKENKEFRFKIKNHDFRSYGSKIITDLGKYVATVPGWQIVPKNFEGIRVSCDSNSGSGWFLLRLSLHDPVIPLNIESDTEDGVRQIVDKLTIFLDNYEELDKSALLNH